MSNTIPSSCRVPLFVGNKEIKFAEKAVPEPETGQLLLRVRGHALCGSERPQFFDGTSVTPGHEATGTVVAAGPGTRTPVGTTGAVGVLNGLLRPVPLVPTGVYEPVPAKARGHGVQSRWGVWPVR